MDLDTPLLKRGVPLSEQVYHFVRALIVTGRMRPGEAVIEAALAARIGVSRTPVREALKRLSDEGLIDVFAQSGTFIAPISLKALEEAYLIRTALEAESASRAAGRLTEADKEAFSDNVAAHELAIKRQRFGEAIRLDDLFHRMIAEVNGLHMLWRAVDISKAQMDRGRHLAIPKPGLGAVTIREHNKILKAIVSGDAAGAERYMRAHLATSLRNTLEIAADLIA
ncbi:GntR family transcriptional regulator [Mesorhizobium marinum]|uniref:GntR family transcriptional regulator n=1 Tax=Mesorhizobium marinum TaxID=3228790 RepID=A0ABV3R1W6_9HYPH